jgi:hypothetical protein
VGFFELPPSRGCLLVYPVVDGCYCHRIILWLDKIRNAAYVLAEVIVRLNSHRE